MRYFDEVNAMEISTLITRPVPLVCVTLILVFCLNISYPVTRLWSDVGSLAGFSENDEIYYIHVADKTAAMSTYKFLVSAFNPDIVSESTIAFSIPHKLTWFVLGWLRQVSGLSPAAFGYLTDIIFGLLGFLAYFYFFNSIAPVSVKTYLAAFMATFFPWAGSVNYLHLTPTIRTLNFTVHPFPSDYYPCIGLNRFGATPVSMILFAFGVGLILRAFASSEASSQRRVKLFLAGLISGATIYAYVFGFLAVMVVIGVMFLLRLSENSNLKMVIEDAVVFGLGAFLPSFSGLLQIMSAQEQFPAAILPSGLLRQHYSYSIEQFVLGLSAWSCRRRIKIESGHTMLTVLTVMVFSLFILFNLQPLLEKILTPYHFSVFFIAPMITGLLTLIGLSLMPHNKVWKKFPVIALTVLTMLGTGAQASSTIKYLMGVENIRAQQLSRHILEIPPDSIIASQPFYEPFSTSTFSIDKLSILPYMLNLTLNRNIIPKEEELFPVTISEMVFSLRREFFLGWLFSGKVQTIAPCPVSDKSPYGDIYYGIHDYIFFFRRHLCEQSKKIIQTVTECELVKENKITHVIFSSKTGSKNLELVQSIADNIWSTEDGGQILVSVSQDKLISMACGEHLSSGK